MATIQGEMILAILARYTTDLAEIEMVAALRGLGDLNDAVYEARQEIDRIRVMILNGELAVGS